MDKFVTKRNDLLAEQVIKNFEVPSDGGTLCTDQRRGTCPCTGADSGKEAASVGEGL